MTTRRASFVLAFILGPALALSTNVSITPARDWPGNPASAAPLAQMVLPFAGPSEAPSVAPDYRAAVDAAPSPTPFAAPARATNPPAPRVTAARKRP